MADNNANYISLLIPLSFVILIKYFKFLINSFDCILISALSQTLIVYLSSYLVSFSFFFSLFIIIIYNFLSFHPICLTTNILLPLRRRKKNTNTNLSFVYIPNHHSDSLLIKLVYIKIETMGK